MKIANIIKAFLFGKKAEKPEDSWKKARGCYITQFRSEIERLATVLSTKQRVTSRFNPEQKCAELYTDDGEVLIQVSVHGCLGIPGEVVIVADSLTRGIKYFIEGTFRSRKLKVRFRQSL
jgi:hypothetical protein